VRASRNGRRELFQNGTTASVEVRFLSVTSSNYQVGVEVAYTYGLYK